MILLDNGTPSSKSDDILESADPSPTAPPSYVAGETDVAVNEKNPTGGDASSSSSPSSFYASAPASTIAGPSNSGGSQQNFDESALFSRVPPRDLSYSSFEPMYLLCQGKTLDKGFPRAPPPSSIQPHPFNSHDITEGDWLSFVDAVHTAATLTKKDVRRSYLALISIAPMISPFTASGVQKIMKNRKVHKVATLIDTWNHHFFEPRKMRVVLMKGETKLSGLTEPPLAPPPPPANFSAASSVNKDDENYRLFIVSL
ncbi:hypothetical protein M413DRAFT_130034 [Hebeloma cylindrosporum]|uniref:Uncharacterized protein n=1 Tax=Hebeloma cylindrosporum TaxID=76867 RepID=A0A0C3CF69_HEBCY|nr:hypothetical protein M413DRAFT_130034 [Hebeloma cylindrosporum h7]